MALEFLHNTNGCVRRSDLCWTVQHVLGVKLRPQLVGCLARRACRTVVVSAALNGIPALGLHSPSMLHACVAVCLTRHRLPLVCDWQVDLLFYLFGDKAKDELNVNFMFQVCALGPSTSICGAAHSLSGHLESTLDRVGMHQGGVSSSRLPLNLPSRAQVLNRHYATGLTISYHFEQPTSSKSYLDCVRECMAK